MRWWAEGSMEVMASSGRRWALVQAALCAVFLSLAAASGVFAFDRYAENAADRRTINDLSRIRDELYVLRPPEAGNFLLQAYGLRGPDALPAPFSSIVVPEGAELHAFLYLKRRRGTVILVSLSRGEAHYLWSDFYGNRRMQRIEAGR